MPGIAGSTQCTQGIKGNRPAESAEQGGTAADTGTIFIYGDGTGDQFTQGTSAEQGFHQSHIQAIKQNGDQLAQDRVAAVVTVRVHDDGEVHAHFHDHVAEEVHEHIEGYEVDNIVGQSFPRSGLCHCGLFEIIKQVLLLLWSGLIFFHGDKGREIS